ncbi:hypothetical protein NBRC116594_08370 [Shimia sp. NS0008-38b]
MVGWPGRASPVSVVRARSGRSSGGLLDMGAIYGSAVDLAKGMVVAWSSVSRGFAAK